MKRFSIQLMGRDLITFDFGEVTYATKDEQDQGHLEGDHLGGSVQYGFTMPTIATPEERWGD